MWEDNRTGNRYGISFSSVCKSQVYCENLKKICPLSSSESTKMFNIRILLSCRIPVEDWEREREENLSLNQVVFV